MNFGLYRDTSKHYALISIQFSDHFLFIITTVPIIALCVLGITLNSALLFCHVYSKSHDFLVRAL